MDPINSSDWIDRTSAVNAVGSAHLLCGLQALDPPGVAGGELPRPLVVGDLLQAEVVLVLHLQILQTRLQLQQVLGLTHGRTRD